MIIIRVDDETRSMLLVSVAHSESKMEKREKKKKVKKFIIHCGFSFLRILLLVLCYISLQSYLMYQKRPYVWLSLFLIENCSVKVVF